MDRLRKENIYFHSVSKFQKTVLHHLILIGITMFLERLIIQYALNLSHQRKLLTKNQLKTLNNFNVVQEPLSISYNQIVTNNSKVAGPFGYCDKGTTTLQIKLGKTAYQIGRDICTVMCSIDNSQCTISISSITVKLRKHAMISKITDLNYLFSKLTGASHKSYLVSKMSKTITDTVYECTYEGLGAGLTTNGFTKEFDIPLTFEQEEILIEADPNGFNHIHLNCTKTAIKGISQRTRYSKEKEEKSAAEQLDQSNTLHEDLEENKETLLPTVEEESKCEPPSEPKETIFDFNNCKIQPTSIGKYISIVYSVEVSLAFSGLMIYSISAVYPLFLYPPPLYDCKLDDEENLNSDSVSNNLAESLPATYQLDEFDLREGLLKQE